MDVEGKASGIEEELIKILEQAEIPVTYAGGIGSLDDLERIREIGNGKIDFTIGSALDLFGGQIPYDVMKKLSLEKMESFVNKVLTLYKSVELKYR